jgi:hypothetical protein
VVIVRMPTEEEREGRRERGLVVMYHLAFRWLWMEGG